VGARKSSRSLIQENRSNGYYLLNMSQLCQPDHNTGNIQDLKKFHIVRKQMTGLSTRNLLGHAVEDHSEESKRNTKLNRNNERLRVAWPRFYSPQ
jgi:hypothetical protein